VDLWLSANSMLPARIEIHVDGDDPATASVEFSGYGQQFMPPPHPANATAARDYELPAADCTGDTFAACLDAELGITGTQPCEGAGRRVCLLPLGRVSPALIEHLASHYRDYYALDVRVMPPAAIPVEYTDPLRDQIDANAVIQFYLPSVSHDAYFDLQATMIAVTAVDIFQADSHFRYVLGYRGDAQNPHAIVSTFRMDPLTYGEPPDERILFSRARKMVTKYIGFIYYALPLSDDPRSPMYNAIGGPAALDMMSEPLPVQ
jgi:predicted Zn-dependent protease